MVYFFFAELTRKILQGNRINEVLNYGSSESVPITLKFYINKTPFRCLFFVTCRFFLQSSSLFPILFVSLQYSKNLYKYAISEDHHQEILRTA